MNICSKKVLLLVKFFPISIYIYIGHIYLGINEMRLHLSLSN